MDQLKYWMIMLGGLTAILHIFGFAMGALPWYHFLGPMVVVVLILYLVWELPDD